MAVSQQPFEVLDPGHQYKLSNGESITFIKRTQGQLVHDGIQNEELLEVLIDRMEWLNAAVPCIENQFTLDALTDSLTWQVSRTARRIVQGVEGTDEPHAL